MLAWLRDLIAPIKAVDATFGQMRYRRDAEMWEGEAHFGPIGHVVEVDVLADQRGPTDEQRAFFGEIQRRYDAMWPAIAEQLQLEASRVGSTTKGLDLVGLNIPKHPGDHADWELSYESPASAWHFRVLLQGLTANRAIAEC
jgi:hypothetical protein